MVEPWTTLLLSKMSLYSLHAWSTLSKYPWFHDPADWYDMTACNSNIAVTDIELDEAFVPGVQLEGPLEDHTVEAIYICML